MPTVIVLAPIAAQLARQIQLDALVPRNAVELALSRHREQSRELNEAKLPEETETFFGHYFVVVRAASQLLAAPAFERLARFHGEVEEEYTPGGPPMSPVYDSFAMQFVLSSVPQGIGDETPYSVLARLLARDPSRARLQHLAESLSDSRLELYRVQSARGTRAQIEPVRGGDALSVHLTGPFLRSGDWGLMRVVAFEGQHFVADSPYLLRASEDDWREHLARVVASPQPPTSAPAAKKASKLSSKEQARRRQKEKAKASRNDPEELLRRYFKHGLSELYWFDYIMDAYAGERRGIVFLAGVPDRPELLPHSAEYEGGGDTTLHPMAQLQGRLLQFAAKEGQLLLATQQLSETCGYAVAEVLETARNERSLLMAYAALGLPSKSGTTSLERFERSREAESLTPEARARFEELKNGWFSVFRVDRIHLDRGFELFDLLRREKLPISERAATRQVALGDLLLGWLCKDSAGTLTLEGGIAHVPSLLTASFLPLVEALRGKLPPLSDALAWKRSAGQLPVPLIAGILEIRENPPLPKLFNTSGDPLEVVTGHYRIRNPARVVELLEQQFSNNGDGTYNWLDDNDTSLARFEISKDMLRVQVNSKKRLTSAQKRLEALLGDAVERSLDAHEDIAQAVRKQRGSAKKQGSAAPPMALPPEVAAQFQQVVLAKIRVTLDEPIPQFKNKTLRQLARSTKTRPDAISWLREQERLLKNNPQLAGLDLRPLWQELSLPYQGIETDPQR